MKIIIKVRAEAKQRKKTKQKHIDEQQQSHFPEIGKLLADKRDT